MFRNLLTLAALASLAAAPCAVAADLYPPAQVTIRVVQSPTGVYAITSVRSTWGATIDGDVHLTANGQEIKVEPILTSGETTFQTWLGSPGSTIQACSRLDAIAWTGPGDNHRSVDRTACAFSSAENPSPQAPQAPATSDRLVLLTAGTRLGRMR